MVIEDDCDIRSLIRMIFSKDPEFVIGGEAESAEEGLVILKSDEAALMVLDQSLVGEMTGLEAAPLYKKIAPQIKIILFTADPGLKVRATSEPAIDAFLIKTEFAQLLPTARRLCGLGSPTN